MQFSLENACTENATFVSSLERLGVSPPRSEALILLTTSAARKTPTSAPTLYSL